MAETTTRSMRIPNPTWTGSLTVAQQEGANVTAKVVAFLDWYRGVPGADLPTRPADPPAAPLDLDALGDAGETVVAFVARAIRAELERERRKQARAAREQID